MSEPVEALERAIAATLFASEEPITVEALAGHLGDADPAEVRAGLRSLAEHYERRGVRLVERGKRWHFESAPDLAQLLRREREQVRRLSRAATEVLAIVAYHEPVSRAEIESIRGVQTSSGTLDVLMEAGWVRVAGRREVPGRPTKRLPGMAKAPSTVRKRKNLPDKTDPARFAAGTRRCKALYRQQRKRKGFPCRSAPGSSSSSRS